MQIKYIGVEKFQIRTKDASVELEQNNVTVNDFSLSGPGEYEKNGVFVEGIADNGNTIFVVTAEEIKICHLGKISHDLREDEAKEIGNIDILFIPLGEEGSINLKQAQSLIAKIDPRVVIPMLYSDLNEFCKSEGATEPALEQLKIKKSELPSDERKSIILTPHS